MRTQEDIEKVTNRIECNVMNNVFILMVRNDQKEGNHRFYIQLRYYANDTKDRRHKLWYGRKWYLSDHMTDDEIVKTAYAAFEAAVKHEIMEGFTVDGITLFNPHVNFEEILKVSNKEVFRTD